MQASGAAQFDEWDRRTHQLHIDRATDRPMLAELARRFLVQRKDQALGLAPTQLLPPHKANAWVLFWTAARRVDDLEESGRGHIEDLRSTLTDGRGATFADRCLSAFLRRPEGAGTREELHRLLNRGLDGLQRERHFDRPRSFAAYLDLIHDKSASAMMILDRLLFPGEPTALVARHAEAFAAATQVGDDCRDVRRDLKRGRCFVTLEELDGERAVAQFVAGKEFARRRTAISRRLLDAADAAAARFQVDAHRQTARRLSGMWRHALDSGQVRPTTKGLRLPRPGDAVVAGAPEVEVPPRIAGLLHRRFSA